jgi:asparagine synthase (glutamine-hydrolysing)
MCGIAGILGRLDEANRVALKRMSAALVHRGPDDEGTWESAPGADGQGAMFAFRRLAILDLSPTGAQPMVDAQTGHVLLYNGEVYNFQALRQRLTSAGHTFRSTGDAAVVLRALGTEGPAALPSFRGMFALALWDPRARTLLLARDPLGIKPLYVARAKDASGNWSIAFASEMRALLASGLLGTPQLDPSAVASVVWNGFVVGPGTMVRGVELLPPGHWRLYGERGEVRHSEAYWRMPGPDEAEPVSEAALAEALEESVRLHLISDRPLGVFLSGGIDSSAVANLAQKANRGPVHTFTLSFDEEEFNEGPVARSVADAIGTEHQEVRLTEGQFVGELEAALDSLDQPTFDALNSYYMSHAVRQAGFTVALVGTGGDELFGGYGTFRDIPVVYRWSRRLDWMPRAALVGSAQLGLAALQPQRGEMPRQTRWAKLPEMVRNGDSLVSLYQLAYALFLPAFQRDLLGQASATLLEEGLPQRVRQQLQKEIHGRSPLAAISVLEQRLFLGERLLRDNDVASMAASIEQRLPLVDSVFLEQVFRVPDTQRYEPVPAKMMLRRIGLRGLDPALFQRPKRGFVLPFERWIRQGLSPDVDSTLRDEDAVRATGLEPSAVARLWQAFLDGTPGLNWSRVWTLYVLVRWCRRHAIRL